MEWCILVLGYVTATLLAGLLGAVVGSAIGTLFVQGRDDDGAIVIWISAFFCGGIALGVSSILLMMQFLTRG